MILGYSNMSETIALVAADPAKMPIRTCIKAVGATDRFELMPASAWTGHSSKSAYVYGVSYRTPESWAEIIRMHGRSDEKLPPKIIFDCTMEGPPLTSKTIEDIIAATEENRSVEKVIIATQNYIAVEKINNYESPCVKALFFHYFLAAIYLTFQGFSKNRWVLREYVRTRYPFRRSPPAMRYTCLTRRARPHRLVIFGWLLRHRYLDHGNVSFHGGASGPDQDQLAKATDDAHIKFPSFREDLEVFAKNRHRIPFRNFDAPEVEDFATSFRVPAYAETPLSLIPESEMFDSDVQRVTEKTFKCLIAGHRFITAGNPHSLFRLRQMGFLTFDNFIDQGYDKVFDSEERLRRALESFARYMEMPDGEYRDLLSDSWFDCQHNLYSFLDIAGAEITSWCSALREAIAD